MFKLLKPYSELVLILSILKRNECTIPGIQNLLDICWEISAKGNYIWQLLLARPDILELAGICVSFKRSGFNINRLRDTLAIMLMHSNEWAGHLPIWRRLAILHSLDALDIKRFPTSPLVGSFLYDKPPPWVISDELMYAFTHEVFYFTDFGRNKKCFANDIEMYLSFSLPIWIDTYIERKNLDLLAELIVCAKYLDIPISDYAITFLIKHQAEDGSFPGPIGAGQDLPFEGKSGRYFASRYHTTLVTLLVLSI
jgi:hypothetical protein